MSDHRTLSGKCIAAGSATTAIIERWSLHPSDLKKAGLASTAPRLKVLNFLESARPRRASAEDIYQGLRAAGKETAIATIYRVLRQCEDAGLLRRVTLTGGCAVYELNPGSHHDHMLCLHCRRIHEFVDPVIEARQRAIAARDGWELNDYVLMLYGLCPECRPH